MKKISSSLLSCTAGIVVFSLAGTLAARAADPKPAEDPQDLYKNLHVFGEAFEIIRDSYVDKDKAADDKLIQSAIGGMLGDLDPHSSFLNKKNYADMQVQTKGAFGGLGIEITQENGLIKIIAPIDGTPAARAGLRSGDLITHIGTEAVPGLSLDTALEKMRGAPGTNVTLTIRRNADKEKPVRTVTLTRETIIIRSVKSAKFGNVGYVRITQFNENTGLGVKNALAALRKQGAQSYLLDLRNNPGGLLDQAVAVSDAFLERGVIVSTRGRDNLEVQRFEAEKGDDTAGAPVAVLINGGSASASEIVAGALQDHRRATVIGTKSFGKGSVQTIIPLKSENSALRITTARYYTPSGRSIQSLGIVPDVEAAQGTFTPLEQNMPELTEEALHGHLLNLNKAAPEPKKDDKAADKSADKAAAKSPEKAPEKAPEDDLSERADIPDPVKDYQLNYALNILRAVSATAQKPVETPKEPVSVAVPKAAPAAPAAPARP